jgi:TonB-dependent starch-binding outer membrane protein SusC
MRKFYMLFLSLLMMASAYAQDAKVTVKGKVTDPTDGNSLPGVSIIEKGTINGASTDVDGDYSVKISPNATLVFSYVGYKTQEIIVGSRTNVDVSLIQDTEQLTDVVVIGYGTQEKKDITGSIASINNKDFKNQPTSNMAGNIQGKLAGVNITSASGTPGAGLLVNIRGASNPLYVVDGIPMLSESNSSQATSFDTEGTVVGNGQNLSSISDINPNDIESIDVLKDASAAAIYGARAANGVILITTKRGKSGKSKFNFNYYTGIQEPARKIKFLNSQQFIDLNNEARANDLALYNADNTVFGPGFDPSVLTDPLHYTNDGTNTVWLDEVLKNAPIHNYEISSTGGNDKTKFYVGGSYFDQDGMVINSWYKRLSARVNLDHQATDKLSFGVNFSASHSLNRRSFNDNTYTGIITNALGAPPLMPVYDANGKYSNFEDYSVNWLSDNPVLSANEIIANTTSNRLIGSIFAEYKFTSALKFRTSWSTDYSSVVDDQFFSPITADAEAVSGKAYKSNFGQLTWLNENIFTFNKSIGQSNFNAIAGFTMQETVSDFSSINAQGFPSGSGLKNISSAAVTTNAKGNGTPYGLVSYLGRVNYDYKGKYLLAATVRVDGSSRFPVNNRFAVFPSASVGWRISQEDFFGKGGTVTDLKLRASYGVTGDQEIGNFQNVSFWQPTKYLGVSGLKPRNLADKNLSWQVNQSVNVGLDWELFAGRINGSVDYFKSNKTKLLSNDVIPGTTGFSTITRNAGEIENRGWEFTVNAIPITNNKFRWNSSFNISFIQNEIKKITNDGLLVSAYSDFSPTHVLKVGQPVGTFWAVKYLGVNPANGDALFQNKNGDAVTAGEVSSDDAQLAGKAIPDFFGGWNNTFNVGKFDFLLALQYSKGNSVYNMIKAFYLNMGWSNDGGLDQVFANNPVEVEKRWKKPGDVTNIPRASFINQNYVENSTQYIEDASFLRIRTLSIGYNLKPKNTPWIDNIRIYTQVQNLFVFTNYTGFDPEVSSTGSQDMRTAGVDYAAYPQPRTWTIGFNIGF